MSENLNDEVLAVNLRPPQALKALSGAIDALPRTRRTSKKETPKTKMIIIKQYRLFMSVNIYMTVSGVSILKILSAVIV